MQCHIVRLPEEHCMFIGDSVAFLKVLRSSIVIEAVSLVETGVYITRRDNTVMYAAS